MAERIPILVIDDDAELRELLEYNLRLAGFEVYLAADGPSGIEAAQELGPSVILLDVTMEGMDGLEVLSDLRHDRRTEEIPVFMLTGKSSIGDIERAFEIGADDYITKPVEMMKLGRVIKEKMAKCAEKRGKKK
ncbi:MAG: response regulator [Planctomycetota bacterium]|nr:MAG: response regulator [Planctomycetota bacterium]